MYQNIVEDHTCYKIELEPIVPFQNLLISFYDTRLKSQSLGIQANLDKNRSVYTCQVILTNFYSLLYIAHFGYLCKVFQFVMVIIV